MSDLARTWARLLLHLKRSHVARRAAIRHQASHLATQDPGRRGKRRTRSGGRRTAARLGSALRSRGRAHRDRCDVSAAARCLACFGSKLSPSTRSRLFDGAAFLLGSVESARSKTIQGVTPRALVQLGEARAVPWTSRRVSGAVWGASVCGLVCAPGVARGARAPGEISVATRALGRQPRCPSPHGPVYASEEQGFVGHIAPAERSGHARPASGGSARSRE